MVVKFNVACYTLRPTIQISPQNRRLCSAMYSVRWPVGLTQRQFNHFCQKYSQCSALGSGNTVSSSAVTVLECRTAMDFKCANNLCLPSSVECDGHDQCGDGSDEAEHCGAFVVFYFVHFYRAMLMQSAVMPQYVVCLSSVCLSVCLSVRTFRYCDHIDWNTSQIISRPNSLIKVHAHIDPNIGDLVQPEHPQN